MSCAGMVYVIDDDDSILDSLSFLLDAYGFEVMTFADPLEFLDAASALRPGCMIIDLSMPGIDGFRLYTQLLARGTCMPALMMSGHADERAESRALELGFYRFLRKPVDATVLVESVEHLLGMSCDRPAEA